MSDYSGTQPELWYSLPAPVTKNTFGAATCISALASTSIPRCAIPALYFDKVGKSIHFEANGILQATATSVTFTPAIGLDGAAGTLGTAGGATLAQFGAYTTAAATTNLPWSIEGDIVCQAVGSLGTSLEFDGEMDVSPVASGSAFSTTRAAAMISNLATGINNEAQLWLELFSACSVSAAGNTITTRQFKVYLEN